MAQRATCESTATGLRFTALGGPLVAVVGLCGGAGATTLTHLIATAAARQSTVAVLAMDTGGPTAALALYANAATPRSLPDIAAALDRGDEPAHPLFAVDASGLRILSGGPRVGPPASAQAIGRVLGDARAAHGLTLVDCGSLTADADLLALRSATHVMWVIPATVCATRRARALLDRLELVVPGRELLVARHDAGVHTRAPLPDLLALAERRCAPLTLVPHVAGYDQHDTDQRIEQASVALQALAGVLQR